MYTFFSKIKVLNKIKPIILFWNLQSTPLTFCCRQEQSRWRKNVMHLILLWHWYILYLYILHTLVPDSMCLVVVFSYALINWYLWYLIYLIFVSEDTRWENLQNFPCSWTQHQTPPNPEVIRPHWSHWAFLFPQSTCQEKPSTRPTSLTISTNQPSVLLQPDRPNTEFLVV